MSEQKRLQQYADAIAEAERFIEKARTAHESLAKCEGWMPSKKTAAAKRASMDLSRALSELRKGPWL